MFRQLRRESGKHPVRRVHEENLGLPGIDRSEVLLQALPGDLGDHPRQFHTGGTAADDHEGKPGPSLLRVRFPLGHLEGIKDLLPDPGTVLDALEPRGHFLPGVMAVVVVLHPRCDDQRVIVDDAVGKNDAPP